MYEAWENDLKIFGFIYVYQIGQSLQKKTMFSFSANIDLESFTLEISGSIWNRMHQIKINIDKIAKMSTNY